LGAISGCVTLPLQRFHRAESMPRRSADERLADIEKRLAANKAEQSKLRNDLRAERSRQKKTAQKARAHAGIVLGLGMAEHALSNPRSEVRRVAIRVLEHYLATEKPAGDPPVAELLERLRAAVAPANAAAAVPEAAE
jgi:hypothetical protein